MVLSWGASKGEDVNTLIAKKQYAKAIELIKEQLKAQRNDPRLRLQLSDLLVLANRTREAVAILGPLADEYAKEGFAAKAISVLKKIQKIDPGQAVDAKLASLIQEKQRVATASLPPSPPSAPGGFEIGIEEIGVDFSAPVAVPARSQAPRPPEPVRPAPPAPVAPPPAPVAPPPAPVAPPPAPVAPPPAPVAPPPAPVAPPPAPVAPPPAPPKPAVPATPAPAPVVPVPAAPEPGLDLGSGPGLDLEPAADLQLGAPATLNEFDLSSEGESPAGLVPSPVVDQDLFIEGEAALPAAPEPLVEVQPEPEPEGGLLTDELLSAIDEAFQNLPGEEALASSLAAEQDAQGGNQIVVSPLFKDFSVDEMVAVIHGLNLMTFQQGQVIIRQGEPGNSLYMLTAGTVRAFVKGPDGKQRKVADLEEGAFFGEVSILTGQPRTATIVALEYCELLELDRATLDSITATHPHVRDVLQEFAKERMAHRS